GFAEAIRHGEARAGVEDAAIHAAVGIEGAGLRERSTLAEGERDASEANQSLHLRPPRRFVDPATPARRSSCTHLNPSATIPQSGGPRYLARLALGDRTC